MASRNSVSSSNTHVQAMESVITPVPAVDPEQDHAQGEKHEHHVSPGHGESAIPGDKVEEELENAEEDWEDDPRNPRNWSSKKKWTSTSIVAFYSLIPPLASSMMAPGLPEVALKYGITSPTIVAMSLSIFLLSFAFAPLVVAPLSEIYGRTWVLHISNLASMAFSLGCAFAPDTGSFIGFRFLAGFAGSGPVAIGGGTIADLFSAQDRASAMAVFTLGPLLGPVIGPIAGGFMAQSVDVKWIFIVIAALCALGAAIGIPLLRETYAPVIRLRLAKKSADPEAAAKDHPALAEAHGNRMQYFMDNLTRPITLLFRSFICFILSLYMAFTYGIYYLMFTTFAEFFSTTYGFRPGVGGLTYLGLGVGFFLATIVGAKFSNDLYIHLSKKNGGKGTPEMRIPSMFLSAITVPIGLFWYGWSAQAKLHWIMPIIGTSIFSFGVMCSFLPISLYLVDAFRYAASATAAAAMFRSLLGFAFPLFGKQMFDALTIGGGNSLLAGLAILLGVPFPLWIYYRGEQMRAKSDLTR